MVNSVFLSDRHASGEVARGRNLKAEGVKDLFDGISGVEGWWGESLGGSKGIGQRSEGPQGGSAVCHATRDMPEIIWMTHDSNGKVCCVMVKRLSTTSLEMGFYDTAWCRPFFGKRPMGRSRWT